MPEESWLLKNVVALIAVFVSVCGWIVSYLNSSGQFKKARVCSKIDAAEQLVHEIADEAVVFWTSKDGDIQDQVRLQRITVMLKRFNTQVKMAYGNKLPRNYAIQLKGFRQACTYIAGPVKNRTTYAPNDRKVLELSDMSLQLIQCIDLA